MTSSLRNELWCCQLIPEYLVAFIIEAIKMKCIKWFSFNVKNELGYKNKDQNVKSFLEIFVKRLCKLFSIKHLSKLR